LHNGAAVANDYSVIFPMGPVADISHGRARPRTMRQRLPPRGWQNTKITRQLQRSGPDERRRTLSFTFLCESSSVKVNHRMMEPQLLYRDEKRDESA